jgi:peptidoglycan/LPS O-acetylase OafA/YrhL
MRKQRSQKERIQSIDMMRGIAALIVVYCHILPATPVGTENLFLQILELLRNEIFQRGQLGVALFFIISGYVVPFSLVSAGKGGIGKFIISRVMRLYPAYWASLIVGIWLINPDVGSARILANLTMAQRFIGFGDILGVYWTLSVELVFYSLIALVFLAGIIHKPRAMGWLCLGVITTTLVFATARRFFDIPLPAGNMIFMSLMFGGAWLRLGAYRNRDLWWIVSAFLLVLLAVCWLVYYPDKYSVPWLLQFSRYLYAVTLFFTLLYWPALKSSFIAYLGRISYSMYLFHMPVNALFATVLPTLGLEIGGWLMFILALVGTIGVSTLTFKCIEMPFVRLGKGLQAYYQERLSTH